MKTQKVTWEGLSWPEIDSKSALHSPFPVALELMNLLLSRLTASTLVKLSIERMIQNGADEVRPVSRSAVPARHFNASPLPNPSIGSLIRPSAPSGSYRRSTIQLTTPLMIGHP
jgi:hypothetical protein